MADESFEDLAATLEWGSQLELTPEQRGKLAPACHKIAGTLTMPAMGVPSFRLKEELEKKRAAIARAETAEKRVAELEAALKAKRDEWCFRRKPVSQAVSPRG